MGATVHDLLKIYIDLYIFIHQTLAVQSDTKTQLLFMRKGPDLMD